MNLDAKWCMNRAGLLNFWYYDDETFTFSDGKLLLRGTNGSGKSVTMQSFLPVLLDGKKSPDRLDPFGSKARKMEDYLLGEKEVSNRDERTGYLYLEYKKQGTDQYITTGIGMQAKRHKGIKSWYFVVTDNRRIGIDIELALDDKGEKIPLSAKQLENKIGQGGYVVHYQKEYMDLVNKYIFGFQSNEAYEDLIKLLIQLRSPKLSKDFKPTVIYEILESALPPLSDDELRHLSETIENMDQTEQQLDQLEREQQATMKLVKQYDLYNQFILAERAKQLKRAEERHNRFVAELKSFENVKNELQKNITSLEMDLRTTEQKLEIAKMEEEQLGNHDIIKLERNLVMKKEELINLQKELAASQMKWDGKRKQLSESILERESVQQEIDKNGKSIQHNMNDLAAISEESAFHLHVEHADYFGRHRDNTINFSLWLQDAKKHENSLRMLKELVEKEQRLQENQSNLRRQSSEKKQEVDSLQQQLEHLDSWFTEEKQRLSDSVFNWIEDHPACKFTDGQKQELARALNGLYQFNRYDDVRGKLLAELHELRANRKTEESITVNRIAEIDKEIESAKDELQYWKEIKMPQPGRAEGTDIFRSQLEQESVAHLPFYAAVEFQDHVSDEMKERLESALRQTGLLDSLITNNMITPFSDSYFQSNPLVLTSTLADYLYPDVDPDHPISKEMIDNVLRSIPLDAQADGISIDTDGTYKIGCLVGHAPNLGPSKFIGRSSRKRYQLEQVKRCEAEIAELENNIHEVTLQLMGLKREIEQIEEWKTTIPGDKALHDVQDEIYTCKNRLEQEHKLLVRIDQQWKKVIAELKEIKLQLHERGSGLNVEFKPEIINLALKASAGYTEQLHELDKAHQRGLNASKHFCILNDRICEKEMEMDELKGEQNVKETEKQKLENEIVSIDERLKLEGLDEIRARIQNVQRAVTQGESIRDEIRQELPRKKAAMEQNEEKLQQTGTAVQFWENMKLEWEKSVRTEHSYKFIEVEEPTLETILSRFETILQKYDRSKLNEQLTKTFFNEQAQLSEYRMLEFIDEPEEPNWFFEEWDEHYEPFINEWQQLKGRRIIQMEYRGQRVTPYFVLESLEKELSEQRGWLDEQDRQLYEDIVLNTIGSILRNRIRRAEQWIREMDKIMANRDNSSGLIFSIAWKPLTAEEENELDTKELVSLLQRNSKFLNEEDLNKITKHFQSRIMKAKELMQLRTEGTTLHQVLKEVLDYRKWFTFVLSYRRENEPKRELTNNAFFRFSGGEKAMAMYIPLFTAAFSRYEEANSMAPYIITLDEAFAGVDETNIRDMFEVVEQLGFNYIMNSQALWGDYDTVSNLSIYELIRPKNADAVSLIRYEWNGRQRTLILDEDPSLELVK